MLSLVIVVPLSLLALRYRRFEVLLTTFSRGIQVVPSIALFGLLMGPLAILANLTPHLRQWGISGIGPAPAMIGIAAYLLLPLASAVLTGIRVAPATLVEAAKGQGLSPVAILCKLQLPLGLGVLAGGLRVAAVQAVGLAALAALIGGGGYGTLIFQGIGQLATDLILLGVLPVVALSLMVDGLLSSAQTALEGSA
ncbi:ABC transporter permease subunit [Pseudoroseomonas globiformis]|uniref:ABC transporter permease subunit n=1 Tax=Teichococcus globiformis TaxID=2307229 RepID=A0ABV7G303_9PROT